MAWMRQTEPETATPQVTPTTRDTPAPKQAAAAPPRPAVPQTIATVGQSVQINGELTAKENLTIEGKVEGQITLTDHSLTIGANGRINATIRAKVVEIVGEVIGNITASDKVTIAPSGSVDGDITAPRISIADGARFKGKIDMEGSRSSSATTSTAKPLQSHQPVKTIV